MLGCAAAAVQAPQQGDPWSSIASEEQASTRLDGRTRLNGAARSRRVGEAGACQGASLTRLGRQS